VLAHGIAETQPFVDGNKRTALIAMLTYLELNGYTLSAADPELAAWIISFSSGTGPEAIADQLRSRLKPID
jgi:death on curing protein